MIINRLKYAQHSSLHGFERISRVPSLKDVPIADQGNNSVQKVHFADQNPRTARGKRSAQEDTTIQDILQYFSSNPKYPYEMKLFGSLPFSTSHQNGTTSHEKVVTSQVVLSV